MHSGSVLAERSGRSAHSTEDVHRERESSLWERMLSRENLLAALNRVYFSTFEFKRTRTFLARLELAPRELADRLELLFVADEPTATDELERLVAETRELVARRFPDLDLSLEWGGRPTPPGTRQAPWT